MRRRSRGALISHAASTAPTLPEGHDERGPMPPPRPTLRRLNGVGTRQGRVVVKGPRGTGAAERDQYQQQRDTEALHFVTSLSSLLVMRTRKGGKADARANGAIF